CGLSIPAAMASTPINGTDRSNGARACSSLSTSVGTSTFAKLYATKGACVSAWVAKAHAARLAATSTCKHRGLHGRVLASCITARSKSSLKVTIGTFKNAARAGAADLAGMGTPKYAWTSGANANAATDFAKGVPINGSGRTT